MEENFAQTAAEPPMEDGLTPAQQDAHADPTNAAETVGVDALEQVARAAETSNGRPRTDRRDRDRGEPSPPNNTLYIGNLYYEVTADQLTKVFERFGEVSNVKLVYDNRGMARGYVRS